MKDARLAAYSLGLAMVVTGLGATYGATLILKSLGVQDIFTTVKLSDAMKVFVSFYLTGAVMSVGFSGSALFMISKDRNKYAGWFGVLAAVSTIATALVSPSYGVAIDMVGIVTLSFGALLCLLGGVLGLKAPSTQPKEPLLSTMQIANSAALSALTAIMTGIAFVPSPTGGFTHIGDTVILIASLLFGSKVGAVTGVIGSVAADMWVGYPRWFVSIPAHGLEGLIAGLGKGKSTSVQLGLCILGGIVMASVYFYVNIFIKGWALAVISYGRDLFLQAGISIVLAVILTRTLQRVLPRFKA